MSRSTHRPRVVVDTNLVLSALVFVQGRVTPLRHLWRDGRILPLISKETASELIRVMVYPKFKLTRNERQELLADYLPYCVTVSIPSPAPETPACRDAFDVPFLQLAIAGRADALMTGDLNLLELAGSFSCPVVTAERFLSDHNPDIAP